MFYTTRISPLSEKKVYSLCMSPLNPGPLCNPKSTPYTYESCSLHRTATLVQIFTVVSSDAKNVSSRQVRLVAQRTENRVLLVEEV